MKILLIYKGAPWITAHILPSFRQIRAEIDFLDLRAAGHEQTRPAVHKRCGAVLSRRRFDLIFLLEGFDDLVDLPSLREARRKGSVIVNYLVDVPQDWWRSIELARVCNFVLVAQKENAKRLVTPENEVVYFPFAVGHDFAVESLGLAERQAGSNELGRPLFVGSAQSRWRLHFLIALDRLRIDANIVGSGWSPVVADMAAEARSREGAPHSSLGDGCGYGARHHWERVRGAGVMPLLGGVLNHALPTRTYPFRHLRFLGFRDFAEILQMANGTMLNFSTNIHGSGHLVGKPQRQSKLRDVEFLCFGAPYATDHDIAREFGLDADYPLVFRSPAELKHLLLDVEANQKHYRAAALKQARHVASNHTWRQRLASLSEIIHMPLEAS